MCSNCNFYNNGCKGTIESEYTGCVFKRTWLSVGEKVKIKFDREVGVIKSYDYIAGRYYIVAVDGHIYSYTSGGLERVGLDYKDGEF